MRKERRGDRGERRGERGDRRWRREKPREIKRSAERGERKIGY